MYKENLKQVASKWRFMDSMELKQPRRRRQQERHKFAYLIVKNNSFARFARAVFIFDISQTFSFFPRREMTSFAVVRTTWAYDDKCWILSSYVWGALAPISFQEHIWQV